MRSTMKRTVRFSARVPGSRPSNASDESSFTSIDRRAGFGFSGAACVLTEADASTAQGKPRQSARRASPDRRPRLLNATCSPDEIVGHYEVFVGVVAVRARCAAAGARGAAVSCVTIACSSRSRMRATADSGTTA